MIRTSSGVPRDLEVVSPQPLGVQIRNVTSELAEASEQSTTGGYVHAIVPAAGVVHAVVAAAIAEGVVGPEPGGCHLADHAADQRVVVVGAVGHAGDGVVQVAIVDVSQGREDFPAVAVVQHEAGAPGDVVELLTGLMHQGVGQLLELGVLLVGDELLADLLVEAAVAGIFPLDDLSVEPADFLLVSVHGLPDQVLNVLGAVAQDDEALDLPVGRVGYCAGLPDPADDVVHDRHLQVPEALLDAGSQ